MIPKIIHFCWLSGDPYPDEIKKCLESWKKYLPEYEIMLWDTNKFDINSSVWVKEAFENKKYAFAADYIRLYALYHYGGIYLDSDILVYKTFNDLLDLPYFIGQEYCGSLEPAAFGTEKNNKWVKCILDYYTDRHFVINGRFDTTTLPEIFNKQLKDKYSFIRIFKKRSYINDNKVIYVFDKNFFNSRNAYRVVKSKKSYCAHNYLGSWQKKDKSFISYIKKTIPNIFLDMYFFVTHNTIKKRELRKNEPKFSN